MKKVNMISGSYTGSPLNGQELNGGIIMDINEDAMLQAIFGQVLLIGETVEQDHCVAEQLYAQMVGWA